MYVQLHFASINLELHCILLTHTGTVSVQYCILPTMYVCFLCVQLHFASIDLELHAKFDPKGTETVLEANSRIAQRMLVIPPLPEDRFLCSFSHIFAGGYAAGYYGYKVQ